MNIFLALSVMIASGLFLSSYLVSSGHAQFTGLVCISYPALSASCPTSPVSIGPVSVGQNITVGLFVQGSDAMGGFDIYIKSDPAAVSPTGAALGTLIANPSLTSICVNGVSVVGTCTVGTANGPGVVEATTIETSGSNECGGTSPCSGVAFTITYRVIGSFSNTTLSFPTAAGCAVSSVASPPDVCVQIVDNVGTTLPENIQAGTVTQAPSTKDTTATGVTCTLPVIVGGSTACTGTVTDISSKPSNPTGPLSFFSNNPGTFSSNPCNLAPVGTNAGTCTVTFSPGQVGTDSIAGIYSGDAGHNTSTGTFTLNVNKTTPGITTVLSSTSIVVGSSISDQATLTGGFPSTGVTGTVTYNLFSNGACTAPGSGYSIVAVGTGNAVPLSATFTLNTPGSYSFNAFYTGDASNNAVASACEPFTVSLAPSFSGHLHWTHHVSLSKSSNAQSWSVMVSNSLPTIVKVVVRIVGSSLQNPSINFDVTCGVSCVNTNGNVDKAAVLALPSYVGPGATFSLTFSQPLSNTFANNKITFTATLYWSFGTTYSASNSRSGAFAVVP